MMKQVVYDLTGLEGFEDVLQPLHSQFDFTIAQADALAKQTLDTLSGQVVLLSDERFEEDTTDEEILTYLEGLSKVGLSLLYIGVPRETPEFERKLKELHVETYLSEELTEEHVQNWLSGEFSKWSLSEENSETIPVAFKEDKPNAVVETRPQAVPTGENVCIVISGVPGAGSTFVGLNLAELLKHESTVNYVEASMRPCLTTWLGAEDAEATASLLSPMQSAFTRDNLNVYTRSPFEDEEVNLRAIATEMESWTGLSVLDLALQDYLASVEHAFASRTVRVLVTTSDLHRCRYLEGIPADIVVINQVPERLPIDEQEYQALWPNATVTFVPYEPEQSISIVQGQPVLRDSPKVLRAMHKLVDYVKGGNYVETRAV